MEKIKVIGESCFIFSGEKSKIITDPWFGESICGGSWSQFPSPSISRSDLYDITHIFISHVHADHCCIESIKKIFHFSPKAKIFILNRKDSSCYLQKKLTIAFGSKIKDRLKIHDPYKEYKHGDFKT